jgi:predicted nuclease of restriction endonuclease-like RecB superfamily
MAKTDDTIENRVYLFESLASSYVAAASELLGSDDEQTRQRATRALAELAYISCVVADTQHLTPEQVRERVLGTLEPEQPPESGARRGKRR